MRSDFHDTEFEDWLRKETDRHRLYADESVWDRIQKRVHRRRWFPFVLTALLTISASVTWVMIDQPDLPINYTANRGTHLIQQGTDQLSQAESTTRNESSKKQILFRNAEVVAEESLSFLIQPDQQAAESSAQLITSTQSNNPDIETELTVVQSNLSAPKTETHFSTPSNPSTPSTIHMRNTETPVATTTTLVTTASESASPASKENTAPQTILAPEQFQTIESVVNAYKGKRTRKSWKMQLSVSPTISYRQLIENTAALQAARSATPAAPALAVPELDNVVNHKPDLGLQFGVSVNRQLTKRFDLIAGLQFNINKYDIRAYGGSREVATVGLSNGGGTGSVSSYTNYRSSGGVWAKWLANYYFSVSAPIGFQYRVAGNGKWSWGIGSTLQPTYLLSNQTYILSTDYKNYLEVPSLIRRWNLNGQLETFIGFQKGKTRWTLGPQARYQILSSYEKAYPVQEYLFDVGVKLGVGL